MKVPFILLTLLALSACDWSGIDVSESQGSIDWSAVRSAKYFAILRAGYGTEGVDKNYQDNYSKAKAAGIKVGAYLYSYAANEAQAEKEANHFISLLKGKQFEWPVYYYIEEQSIFDSGIHNTIAKKFCTVLEANRFYCGIYASATKLNSFFDKELRNKYTVWVNHWGVQRPGYFGTHHVWQSVSDGSCPGVNGRVPLNTGYLDFEPIMKKAHLNGF